MTESPNKNHGASPVPGQSDHGEPQDETLVTNKGDTRLQFEEYLRQSRTVEADPVEQEDRCADLVSRLKDINQIRRLAAATAQQQTVKAAPKSLGQFELLESLGGGGMGQVFRARHSKLGKIQAVKLLHAHRLQDKEATDRFHQEMKAIGRLQHPNIVAAQHADEAEGVPYLVMDYVDGRSLSQVVKAQQAAAATLPVAVACELIRQAAIGIQYAHDQGVVHRDIKPGNIMLDQQGLVRVLDLGLARMAAPGDSEETAPELTTEQQILGTPDYMAPEQLRSSRNVDGRADVYSLGATLYYLLTGQVVYPAVGKSSVLDKALRVLNEPVPNISQIRGDVPKELAAVITECLQKEPEQRIATAADLANRLATWASAGELSDWAARPQEAAVLRATDVPTTVVPAPNGGARPPLRRWLLVGGGFLLPMILLTAVVMKLQLPNGGELIVECDDPDAQITVVAVKGGQEKPLTLSRDASNSMLLTEGTWEVRVTGSSANEFELSENRIVMSAGGKPVLKVTRRMAAEPVEDEPSVAATTPEASTPEASPEASPSKSPAAIMPRDALPDTAATAVDRPSDAELLKRLETADWQPGKQTSLEGYASVPSQFDGINPEWQILPQMSHPAAIISVSPQANYVASFPSSGTDPYIRIMDRVSGRMVGLSYLPQERNTRFLNWSRDESMFVIVDGWHGLSRFTVCSRDGQTKHRWEVETILGASFPTAEWSPDGERILAVNDKTIQQFRPDGSSVESFQAPAHGGVNHEHLRNECWSPDGSRFAVATNGEIRVYGKDGGEPLAVLKDSAGLQLQSHRWHPAGDKILTNGLADANLGERSAARLWILSGSFDRFGFTRLHEMFEAFSPDGKFFVTNYGSVRDLTNKERATLDVSRFGYIQFTTICRWIEPDRLVLFSINRGPGYSVEYSPAGRTLAEFSHPGPVRQPSLTWTRDADRFTAIEERTVMDDRVPGNWRFTWGVQQQNDMAVRSENSMWGTAAFAPEGNSFAARINDSTITVFDSAGIGKYDLTGLEFDGGMSWSSDGRFLAVSGTNTNGFVIQVWSGDTRVAEFGGMAARIHALVWSPDSRFLAIADQERNYYVWDPNQLNKPVTVQNVAPSISWARGASCPKWSPEGTRLAVPSEAGVTLLSPHGEEEIVISLTEEQHGVVWWRPDGKALVIGDTIYDLSGQQLTTLENHHRNLPFFYWLGPNKAAGAWDHGVAFWDDLEQPAQKISLPTFKVNHVTVSSVSQGLNAERISADGRYLIHHNMTRLLSNSGVDKSDVHLIDVHEKKHLWTGLAFHDGTQIRIEPNGRVPHPLEDFDKYLTYVLGYPSGRIFPVTQLQFASRIRLSAALKFAQQVLDFGGSLAVSGRELPLLAADVNDARQLPQADQITSVDLSLNPYLTNDGLTNLGALKSLRKLDLSGTPVSTDGLSGLEKLDRLTELHLGRTQVSEAVAFGLPATLEVLDVSHTDVGDLFLYELKNCPSLKQLDLTGTKSTAEGIEQLRKTLPGCEISHSVSLSDNKRVLNLSSLAKIAH